MSKLNDIETYFGTSVNRAREPERQGEYEDWLIERVRKLETALRRASDENFCLCPYASEDRHTADCLYVVAGEALKEP